MALTDLWTGSERQGLGGIVALSLAVSVAAAALAGVLGTALGAALAVYRIPGRRIIVMALHALLGLPPVVVGLALYLLLSRAGPFGALGLLFTPARNGIGAKRAGVANRGGAGPCRGRRSVGRVRPGV